jgi:hypothetical protein
MKAEKSLGSPHKFNTPVMTDDVMTWKQLQTYAHPFATGKIERLVINSFLIVLKCVKLLINNYSSCA